jgi:hypothetical protein
VNSVRTELITIIEDEDMDLEQATQNTVIIIDEE